MFDVISAQGGSLFGWLVRRFVLLFGAASIFAFIGMIGVSLIKQSDSIFDMVCVFLPTAFVLSSFCVFISLLGNISHNGSWCGVAFFHYGYKYAPLPAGAVFLFPRTMSQADAKHPFDECREGQYPAALLRVNFDAPSACCGVVDLFVRYAGISSPRWMINKAVMVFVGSILWISIFLFCKKRVWE